jgi:hypothetical protein
MKPYEYINTANSFLTAQKLCEALRIIAMNVGGILHVTSVEATSGSFQTTVRILYNDRLFYLSAEQVYHNHYRYTVRSELNTYEVEIPESELYSGNFLINPKGK